MKTPLIISTVIILTLANSYSQDKLNLKDLSDRATYFSISYLAGTSFEITPAFNSSSGIPVGYNGGIEIGYHPSGSAAFFLNFNICRLKSHTNSNSYRYSDDVIELTLGPRIYLNSGKSFFIEGALGTYIFSHNISEQFSTGDQFYYNTFSSPGMGFEIGCGKDFKLSEGMTFTLKTKLHDAFPELKSAMYMGVYSAISFDSRNSDKKLKRSRPDKSWAITLTGGIGNPEFFYNRKYNWGVNYGIETSFKISPKVEFCVSVVNNKIVSNNSYYSFYNINNYILEIATGPRFIMNLNNVSPFLETGIGLFNNYLTSPSQSTIQGLTGSTFGMNFGTGILINLTRYAGMLTKGKFNFLFSENPHLTPYFALSTGVRVYL